MQLKVVEWFKYKFSGWHPYHNPYYYWWKTRKYFKRPKAHLVKGEYNGYFGLPCREDSYHKGLNFFMRGLGWKDKWNSPRHEWDPIICFIWTNPWKTWVPNEFSKQTRKFSKFEVLMYDILHPFKKDKPNWVYTLEEKGFYNNKQYWFGWVFNWVKPNADWRDESHVSSRATWEAILDYHIYKHKLHYCFNNHIWKSGVDENAHDITISNNLTNEALTHIINPCLFYLLQGRKSSQSSQILKSGLF